MYLNEKLFFIFIINSEYVNILLSSIVHTSNKNMLYEHENLHFTYYKFIKILLLYFINIYNTILY